MFKNLFKEKSIVTPNVKTAAEIEAEETKKYIDTLAQKMVAKGAVPDISTATERLDSVITHSDSGTTWASQHKFENDEEDASLENRQTTAQKYNNAILAHQVLVKEVKKKGKDKIRTLTINDIFG